MESICAMRELSLQYSYLTSDYYLINTHSVLGILQYKY